MSHENTESAYTPQELEENSRVDALAICSLVLIAVSMVIFYVAS